MRAMSHSTYGKPDVLRLVEIARPTPKAGQVLVRVVAGSVNPVDWKRASGALRLVMPVPLEQLPAAWERSMSGRSVGKIVVDVG